MVRDTPASETRLDWMDPSGHYDISPDFEIVVRDLVRRGAH
jgi:hypothetical protein